jgi:hypothetical protein
MLFDCVCLSFQHLNQLSNFYETWFELYAIVGHPIVILINFLQSIITAGQKPDMGLTLAPLYGIVKLCMVTDH